MSKLKQKRKGKGQSNAGRKSTLTQQLTLGIRKLYLNGYEYVAIQDELKISESTWDRWVWLNYEGFRVFLNDIKKERFIKKAEKVSNEILEAPHSRKWEKYISINDRVLAVKQKEAEFVRETLAKEDGYSKRTEHTGKGGKDLIPEQPILGGRSVKK